MRVVITVVGRDRVGIIAAVSGILAAHGINILNINQTILEGFFNMIMIVDMHGSDIGLQALQQELAAKGVEMGLDIKAQREDIFKQMHQI